MYLYACIHAYQKAERMKRATDVEVAMELVKEEQRLLKLKIIEEEDRAKREVCSHVCLRVRPNVYVTRPVNHV
jgi:hypothetical protein